MKITVYIMNTDNLPDPKFNEKSLSELPDYRKEKCLRYKNQQDRKLCLASGLLLNLISKKFNFSVDDIVFSKNGKPILPPDTGAVNFNISHSGKYAVCCVSESQVGCDIEKITDKHLKVSQRFFHKNEQEYLDKSENKAEAFCRIWTRKESYLKLTGAGITTTLSDFSTVFNGENCLIEENTYFFYEKIVDNYLLSVCSDKKSDVQYIYI